MQHVDLHTVAVQTYAHKYNAIGPYTQWTTSFGQACGRLQGAKIQNSYTFFTMAQVTPVGKGVLTVEDSRSHSDTSHSVGLLWTSDQSDAETSTWQHTTDIHAPGGIRTQNPSKRAVADPHFGPRGNGIGSDTRIKWNHTVLQPIESRNYHTVWFTVPIASILHVARWSTNSNLLRIPPNQLPTHPCIISYIYECLN